MSYYVLHLHKGKDLKVLDYQVSGKKPIEIGEIIAINGTYYKVWDIQHRYELTKDNKLVPVEIKVTARDRDEDPLLYSHPYLKQQRERAFDFFKNVHRLLNTGHSLDSAYDKLYGE